MPWGQGRRSLEKSRYTSKKNAPSSYWSHTFYAMQICAGRMYGKIKKRTNGL
jgi:hypothetical protein